MGFPAKVRYEVYDAIMRYVASGEISELKSMAKMAFSFIRKEIDYNAQYFKTIEALREHGSKEDRTSKAKQTGTKQAKPSIYDDNESLATNASNAKYEVEIDFDALKDFFNKQIDEHGSIFPKVRSFSDERRKMLKARIKQYGKRAVMTVIENAVTSEFLNSKPGFGFDWIIRPRNFLKVLEGNFNTNSNTLNHGRTINRRPPEETRQAEFEKYIVDKLTDSADADAAGTIDVESLY